MTGQLKHILYDQDQAFSNTFYISNADHFTPYDWTFVTFKLADSPFLDVLLDSDSSRSFYTDLISNLLEEFYTPNQTGPLFERIRLYSEYIQVDDNTIFNFQQQILQMQSNIAVLSAILAQQIDM